MYLLLKYDSYIHTLKHSKKRKNTKIIKFGIESIIIDIGQHLLLFLCFFVCWFLLRLELFLVVFLFFYFHHVFELLFELRWSHTILLAQEKEYHTFVFLLLLFSELFDGLGNWFCMGLFEFFFGEFWKLLDIVMEYWSNHWILCEIMISGSF